MTDGSDAEIWRVKRILESGDPERLSAEAEGWRRAEAALDALQKRMTQRIELLQQQVTGGGYAVLAEEHGLLTGHVDELKYNAQSNGVGRKALAETLHEVRPKIQQVATEYESTVVNADGDVTASTAEAETAELRANQRAQEIMSSADDRFQQLYANTSAEPPQYQGPGDTGRTYRPGANRGGSVDPATGRYVGTPGYDPQTGVVLPDQPGSGPRTEFPSPGTPGGPGGPGAFPGGPGGGGFPGAQTVPGGGAGVPGGTGPVGTPGRPFGPWVNPAGTAPGAGPLGRGTGPAGASGRAPVSRPGVPMMGGPGGMHGGGGRSGAGGRGPGGRAMPGAQPSSVYGPGGRGRKGRRDEDGDGRPEQGNGPYDDELFTVDEDGVDGVIRPEQAPHRFPAGPRITSDPSAYAGMEREYVVSPPPVPPVEVEQAAPVEVVRAAEDAAKAQPVVPLVAPPSTGDAEVKRGTPPEALVMPPSVASLADKYAPDAEAGEQAVIRPRLRRRGRP